MCKVLFRLSTDSALCTLFLCTDTSAFDAVRAAGALWRETALEAGRRTDAEKSGIGSFHVHLFDTLERLIYERQAL